MASTEDLALDLEELKQLHTIAKRPRVVSLISSQIRNLEEALSIYMCVNSRNSKLVIVNKRSCICTSSSYTSSSFSCLRGNSNIKCPKGSIEPLLTYATLGSFSWDQDNDKLKIYVSLEGVDQEKIEADFKPMSFDIKFHDVQGKNYRYAVPKLNKEIVPEKCKVLVKPKRVVVTLVKASKGNWLDLHFKEDKNMYEEGDEEMKRTIAKAWSDARSGKTADPLKGYP
ncbi:UNVERIFIED_CONTAM: Calcyclin-binding protein [Sesamum calycinum]|uniref:Calcyclin-binding protein n=1 Tax=Sesamum calycinum TaxID=2727403 RepID=A0AAW2N3W8_9LAMI